MVLQEIFENVTTFFDQEKIEFAVIGGFALYGFGYVRATQDIDFITRIENLKKVVRLLECLGFESAHCSTTFSNHKHPLLGGSRVAILYVGGFTADVFSPRFKEKSFSKIKSIP